MLNVRYPNIAVPITKLIILLKLPPTRDIRDKAIPIADKMIVKILAQFFHLHNPLPTKIPKTPNAIKNTPKTITPILTKPSKPGSKEEIIELKKAPPKRNTNPARIVNPEPI